MLVTGGRPQLNCKGFADRTGRRERYCARHNTAARTKIGVPDAQLARASSAGNNDRSISACATDERCVDDDDVGLHLIVNVATYGRDANAREPARACLITTVQFQLEAVALREGVNVMTHPIEIWKSYFSADRDNQDVGLKLQVALSDLILPVEADRARGTHRRHECDDGVLDRRATI